MKITLRSKPVKDGNRSLFLEYYDKGKRTYEFLRLYIIPETDDKAKKENENALKKAQAIKAERTIHPETIPTGAAKDRVNAGTENGTDSRLTLLEWIGEYTNLLTACGNYSKACLSQTATVKDAVEQYLASLRKKDIMLSKIDARFHLCHNYLFLSRTGVPPNRKGYQRMVQGRRSDTPGIDR